MLRFFLRGSLSSDKVLKTGLNLFEVVILSLFIFLTFLFASLLPVDQDSVNFVLGIEEYNPLIHQPHFPGYPVYIFLGKVFASLFGSAEKGAVCLSIFSGALSILLLIRLLMQHFERSTADLCGALFSLNLVFFEFAHKIFSEIPALALLLFAITVLGNPQAASRKRWVVSLLFLGMLLGVRLSWWPFVPAYLLSGIWNKRGRPAFIGFGLGILVWFI
ncbi:MAG: glycosyltransferase family 39 protein, partial [Nitrospinota bacterium]